MCDISCDSDRQGGAPSPFDRNFGTKISARAMQWISTKLKEAQGKGTGHGGRGPCTRGGGCLPGVGMGEGSEPHAREVGVYQVLSMESWVGEVGASPALLRFRLELHTTKRFRDVKVVVGSTRIRAFSPLGSDGRCLGGFVESL